MGIAPGQRQHPNGSRDSSGTTPRRLGHATTPTNFSLSAVYTRHHPTGAENTELNMHEHEQLMHVP
eukprot:3834655-Pleurochrysis_carterae.AAC.2